MAARLRDCQGGGGEAGGVQPCGETMRRLVSKRIERMFDGMLN